MSDLIREAREYRTDDRQTADNYRQIMYLKDRLADALEAAKFKASQLANAYASTLIQLHDAEARIKELEGVVLEVEMSRDADTARRHAEGVAEGIAMGWDAAQAYAPPPMGPESYAIVQRRIAARVVGAMREKIDERFGKNTSTALQWAIKEAKP